MKTNDEWIVWLNKNMAFPNKLDKNEWFVLDQFLNLLSGRSFSLKMFKIHSGLINWMPWIGIKISDRRSAENHIDIMNYVIKTAMTKFRAMRATVKCFSDGDELRYFKKRECDYLKEKKP